jgi:hypothetical protein
MTGENTPVWAAALVAAGCVARHEGRVEPVAWRCLDASIRYTATEAVVVEPFGLSLDAGDILDVWWQPGDTAYTLSVKPCCGYRS